MTTRPTERSARAPSQNRTRSPADSARVAGNVVPILTRGGPVNLVAWRHMLQAKPLRPTAKLTRSQYEAAPTVEQRAFDGARKRYHRGISDIETLKMQMAHHEIDCRVDGNDGCPPTARTGVILNGMPFLGKSTTMLRWGRGFELDLREELGVDWDARTSDGATFAPVVHVILGDDDGPKGLCQKIMRFFDEPFREHWDESELTARIQRLTVSCGTRVLLVDQMQNLRMSNRSARQTAEHLKELMDVLPVTIVGAGVQMGTTGFLTEGGSPAHHEIAQIGRRFSVTAIRPYEIETSEGRSDWLNLLGTVGQRLVLLARRDADVPGMSDYLFERTAGVTGDLMDLLRLGANAAIGTTERMTVDLLDGITLSARASRDGETSDGLPDVAAAVLGRAIKRAQRVAQ